MYSHVLSCAAISQQLQCLLEERRTLVSVLSCHSSESKPEYVSQVTKVRKVLSRIGRIGDNVVLRYIAISYRSDIGKFSKVGRISEVIIRRRLKFGSMT